MSANARIARRANAAALPSVGSQTWKRALVVAGICLVPILLYVPFYNEPFMKDEGYYASAARAMLHGAVPYTDFFDNKPPLIYMWYAASSLLFGENLWGPRLLVSLTISLATLCVYVTARLLFSSHRDGTIAAGAFALSIGLAKLETNANTEYFMLLPMTAGFLAFTLARQTGNKWWYLAAGVLGGATVFTKTIYVIPMVFLFFYAAWHNRRALRERPGLLLRATWAGPSLMFVGALAVFSAIAIPLLILGAFGDMMEALTYYSVIYSERIDLATRFIIIAKSPLFITLVTGPWIVVAMLGAILLLRCKNKSNGVLLGGWLLANLLSIYVAGRFYHHYYVVLLPAMALLIPVGVDAILRNWRTIPAQAFLVLGLPVLAMAPIALTLNVYLQPTPDDRHLAKYENHIWETQSDDLAEWLSVHTQPGDYIYNLGFQSELYFQSRRQSPTRFFFDHAFGLDSKYEQEAIRELTENPPAYVVDSAIYEAKTPLNYYSEPIHEWVEQNYDYVGKIYYADVWQLKKHQQ